MSADAAGIFGAKDDDHAQLRGHDVQPLLAIFTDLAHLTTAAQFLAVGTLKTVRLDQALAARKGFRQVAQIAPRRTAAFALGRDLRVPAFFDFGNECLEVFESQLPFGFTELLRLFAVNRAVQLGHRILPPQTFRRDADPLLGRKFAPFLPANVFYILFCQLLWPGFLAHFRPLRATMCQKTSLGNFADLSHGC